MKDVLLSIGVGCIPTAIIAAMTYMDLTIYLFAPLIVAGLWAAGDLIRDIFKED